MSHTFTCLCGAKSPRLDSREGAYAWHGRHVLEDCRAQRTRARQRQLGLEDVDELLEHARRLRPINPGLNGSSTSTDSPRDASLDKWGRRQGGSNTATWVDGNCLRLSLATAMQVDVSKVPDPTPDFALDDWFDVYNSRLAKPPLCIRLEEIAPGSCPPIGRPTWIAVLHREASDHAIVCRAGLVIHDPQDKQLNGLEVRGQDLAYGLRIVSADAPRTDRWGKPLR